MIEPTSTPATAGAPRADVVAAGDDPETLAVVRELHAQIAELRAEIARKDEALAALAARLVPVEQAREEGANEEREARREAEDELRALRQTKIYRLLLRPRNALYLYRRRRGRVR